MITIKTDSSELGMQILHCCRFWRRREKGIQTGRQVLQVGSLKIAILQASANNGVVFRRLPDLLQLAGIDRLLVLKSLMHGDAVHPGECCNAGHGNWIEFRPERDQCWLR